MKNYNWLNKPGKFNEDEQSLIIKTQKGTDMWQRTHYGFSKNNAPMYLTKSSQKDFIYEVKTVFNSQYLYDQCGIMIYLNENNWAKFSSEYENDKFQRLGGVVTKDGYSDWATQDIKSSINTIYYRVTRETNDFIVEYSFDNIDFHQMRIFNLAYGNIFNEINVGLYACSPQGNGFEAKFISPHFIVK
ncbi:DUF1349 domain-containing protein [Lentilactobacillus hilgardii]|uniref:DUF1349 domain-containing protein n=1 Tax=Lentilactobacillus hilgardii TaxID=1588 RepID=UPI0021C36D8D|nr:DUF1349 domain-containing protein [Lentilactobacillus hilgardii]MCP9333758.1 DUF1349 domain-containing protein [Lentilactobacillus hilgardii]MCP9350350.1 DUF1349 domain-containing protein [Lentilactobacillus hilgardii]MCP9353244.1 DUF1349 domain-containing protein [Lentilactobacillus hilgardii]